MSRKDEYGSVRKHIAGFYREPLWHLRSSGVCFVLLTILRTLIGSVELTTSARPDWRSTPIDLRRSTWAASRNTFREIWIFVDVREKIKKLCTFASGGQEVPLIVKIVSEMESSDDLRSELYTTFLSGMD